YAALNLMWKWWNAAERKLFFARRDFALVSLPAGVLWFITALAVETGLFVAAGRDAAVLRGGLRALEMAALISAISIAHRLFLPPTGAGLPAVFLAHLPACAGRAAVSAVILVPAFAADRLIYADLYQRSDWLTGPLSGNCTIAMLVLLYFSGKLMRSRAGLWTRRHLDSWSYSGNLLDVWNDIVWRIAAADLAGGRTLLDIRTKLAKEAASGSISPGHAEQLERLPALIEKLAQRAEEFARMLDPKSRGEQI